MVQNFTASAADAADVVPILFGAVPGNSAGNLTASVPAPQAPNTPHLAAIDLGTAQPPTALGSAVLILTADPEGRLFANSFE